MKRYSIYWTVIVNKNGEVHKETKSCDVVASNFVKAASYLHDNVEDFNLEFISSVYSYDVILAE